METLGSHSEMAQAKAPGRVRLAQFVKLPALPPAYHWLFRSCRLALWGLVPVLPASLPPGREGPRQRYSSSSAWPHRRSKRVTLP